ncbi:MAG: hypothetical protein QG664_202 [Patescibacteria group bacterium]|nr:hypothetical protein [Patescibacteria group bacterium]
MPKKKVIHIIQSLDNGGCENMLLRMLPLLSDGFEHGILTLREPGELAPRFTEKGIPVTTINWGGFFDFPGYRRLLSETRLLAPDCIITYLFHADMIGRLFLQPALGWRMPHGNSMPIVPFLRTTYNHQKYLVARILEWLTRPFVRQYLANSEAVKDFYTEHLGVQPEKITVIPNGIDIDYFDSIIPDKALRESLGIKSDDFIVICVANLHPNKGHRYLLQAFEAVYKKHPETYLLIVGDGVERAHLKNQIHGYASKNNIAFLGRRTDVPELLKISDCFILPTLFEGQSNALLEAMGSGLPVITTDIPENRSLVENDKTGFLVPLKSWKKIVEITIALIADKELRKKSGRTGCRFLEENFSLKSSANSFSQFLKNL